MANKQIKPQEIRSPKASKCTTDQIQKQHKEETVAVKTGIISSFDPKQTNDQK